MQFIDLGAQRERISSKLDAAIAKVVREGKYILGPEVAEFEKRLGAYLGVDHINTKYNGTDALHIPIMPRVICPGEAEK